MTPRSACLMYGGLLTSDFFHLVGQGLIIEASRSHSDTPHSVGLLWTGDQPDAETSSWHTTHSRDRHPCHRRDSNPHRSKQTAEDPRLRRCGHWDWLLSGDANVILNWINLWKQWKENRQNVSGVCSYCLDFLRRRFFFSSAYSSAVNNGCFFALLSELFFCCSV